MPEPKAVDPYREGLGPSLDDRRSERVGRRRFVADLDQVRRSPGHGVHLEEHLRAGDPSTIGGQPIAARGTGRHAGEQQERKDERMAAPVGSRPWHDAIAGPECSSGLHDVAPIP